MHSTTRLLEETLMKNTAKAIALLVVLSIIGTPATTQAAVVSGISFFDSGNTNSPYDGSMATSGSQAVVTAGFSGWGYTNGSLVDGTPWDVQSGDNLVVTQSGLTTSTAHSYGHTFDGNATNGNFASLAGAGDYSSGNTLTLSMAGVVSATPRTLTLYLGTWATGRVGVQTTTTLSGGILDEVDVIPGFQIDLGTSGADIPGVFSVTFSSATETDLEVEFAFGGTQTGSRNMGVAGYTLTALPATGTLPEPSSFVLVGLAIAGLAMFRRRRR
jgi:hypothetical protein